MKIAFHSYQLGDRGTEICLYKYAKYNQEVLGNESVIISTSTRPTPSLKRFTDEFEVILYPEVWQSDGVNEELRTSLEKVVDKNKFDAFYAIKGGEDDNFMPTNTKRLAHCIFRMDEPHGDVYAGVCKYICDKHNSSHPFVYHIIEKEEPHIHDNLREDLGIPSDAFVLGRHGGADTFNLPFTHNAIREVLHERDDLWFIFLNTNKFYDHERIVYLPWTMNTEYKARFVNTCDAMMHARADGEIFSLATAEFAVRNKPIVTWDGFLPQYYRGHLETLGDRAITYEDQQDLVDLLLDLNAKELQTQNWNVYEDTYSPQNVMKQFNEVFLKND